MELCSGVLSRSGFGSLGDCVVGPGAAIVSCLGWSFLLLWCFSCLLSRCLSVGDFVFFYFISLVIFLGRCCLFEFVLRGVL